MKKLLIIGLMVVSFFTLSACEDVGHTYNASQFTVVKNLGGPFRIVRDGNTGCMYLNNINKENFSAYYDSHGKVMGCGDKRAAVDIYK